MSNFVFVVLIYRQERKMIRDKKECIEFWQALPEKLEKFAKLDDAEIVFGAYTRGGGHKYRRLPIVTDQEIAEFESNNGFEIPLEYRTYLQTFGAGGGGPYYGIYDFRKYVLPNTYLDPNPFTEEVWYDDADGDDDPIWDSPGIAFFGDLGCGAVFGIELNGPSPGLIWFDWQEGLSPMGTFIEFYEKWIDKVENGLERFHLMKSLMKGETRVERPQITFADIVEHMPCDFEELNRDNYGPIVPEGERWIWFDKTPGKVVIDENDTVLKIEIFGNGWID